MCGFIAQLVEHRTGIAEVTGSNPVVAFAATSKFQNEAKQNELQACRDKLVGGTILQVVFKGRHLNHGKPKLTIIGDLLHQINDRKLK